MLEIRQWSKEAMLKDGGALFAKHWEEIALNKRLMVLKMDWARYAAIEEAGALLALSVYDYDYDQDRDTLVGYSVNLITTHLHYQDLLVCSNDLLYLLPDYRKGGAGVKLIRETEREAKARGAKMMLWHAKENTALMQLMPRMGSQVQDVIFSKEL